MGEDKALPDGTKSQAKGQQKHLPRKRSARCSGGVRERVESRGEARKGNGKAESYGSRATIDRPQENPSKNSAHTEATRVKAQAQQAADGMITHRLIRGKTGPILRQCSSATLQHASAPLESSEYQVLSNAQRAMVL